MKLLDRSARNRPMKGGSKASLDWQKLTTEPHLREEVGKAIGARFRALPPSGDVVDEKENAKAVGPDEMLVQLQKFALNHNPSVLREFHQVNQVWRE